MESKPTATINKERSNPNSSAIKHVEVAVTSSVPSIVSDLCARLELWLKSRKDKLQLQTHGEIDLSLLPSETLPRHPCRLVKLRIVDDNEDGEDYFLPEFPFSIHAYELSNEEISTEEIEPSGGDDEWIAGCDSLTLPHVTLDGLWESLIFDSNVKRLLLEYAQSAILFSDKKVCSHIIHWNRILLLHGVPGGLCWLRRCRTIVF